MAEGPLREPFRAFAKEQQRADLYEKYEESQGGQESGRPHPS